jgi:hypothetical protein
VLAVYWLHPERKRVDSLTKRAFLGDQSSVSKIPATI